MSTTNRELSLQTTRQTSQVDLSKMETAFKLCGVLSKSDLVPRSYRNKPENVFLAYIAGQPFGWDVTMSMRSFHIIEGTPSLKPEIQLALVRQAGHSVSVKSSSTEAVILIGQRSDTQDKAEVSYTLEDAKRAGLLGKGNWKTYPEDMLFARCVSRLCRRLFQDVLLGCAYVPEELGAVESPDGDTVTVPAVQELNAPVSDESTVQSDEVVMVSGAQIKSIHTLKASLALTDEQYRAGLEKITGKRSCKLLTGEEADLVIAALQKKAKAAPAPTYWEPEKVVNTAEEVTA